MRIWILKAIIQKFISWLPMKHRLNFLFQKYITRGVQLSDAYFDDKLEHAVQHLAWFERFHTGENSQVLELGTGWYPVVPTALLSGGMEHVTSIDLSPLMSKDNVIETLKKFNNRFDSGDLSKQYPISDSSLFDLGGTEAVSSAKFHRQFSSIVGDAAHLPHADAHFDYIVSNNTLEHIYVDIQLSILKEFHRVLKPDGIMSHFIDMSDHFAHLDKSISVYNYLKYSEKQWALIDNSIQPQNRLRIYHYRALMKQAGFEIIHEEVRPGNPIELAAQNIDPAFTKESLKETAVTHCYLVCRKVCL